MESSGTVISDLRTKLLECDPLDKLESQCRGQSDVLDSYMDYMTTFRNAMADVLVSQINPEKIKSQEDFNRVLLNIGLTFSKIMILITR